MIKKVNSFAYQSLTNMARAVQQSLSCKIPGCDRTSPLCNEKREALSILQQHCRALHPGCVVPGLDSVDGVEKLSGHPFDCGLIQNWLITKDDGGLLYGMPESMLTKEDQWVWLGHQPCYETE